MFTTARLMLMRAANWKRPGELERATSAPTARMATGPDTFSTVDAKFVAIWYRPAVRTGSGQYRRQYS
jgi:hypothetical protein